MRDASPCRDATAWRARDLRRALPRGIPGCAAAADAKPQHSPGGRRRPERSASGVEGRGGRTQRLEVTPAAPLTLPSPPKGRGKEERAPRASMTEAEAPRGGMTKVGRPAAACHPRAWPSHGGRDARRASSFPDSSPPPGERIKERGDAPRKRSRRQRGDAPRGSRWRQRPPLTLPSPPKGRGKEERVSRARMAEAQAARAGMTKVAHAPLFPDSSPPAGERIKERGKCGRERSWARVRDRFP